MADEEVLGQESEPSPVAAARGPRDLWQVPVLAIGAVVLGGGMYSAWVNRPLPDVERDLVRVEANLAEGRYDQGLELLNGTVRDYTSSETLFPEPTRGRYHVLRGRAIYLSQRAAGADVPANHERVLEEFRKAERLLGELAPEDRMRRADALASLGRDDEAWEDLAVASPDDERLKLRRELIEGRLRRGELDGALAWLGEFVEDRAVSIDDRAWVAAREAEIRIGRGFFDTAVAKLLREIPRLGEASEQALAELYLLLGEAYSEMGDTDRADLQLERADELLADSDPLSARVLLAEARLAQQMGELEEARERYERIISLFGSSRSYLPALVGLAEIAAGADEHAAAVEAYRRAVGEQLVVSPGIRIDVVSLWRGVVDLAEARLAAGDSETALAYASVLDEMFDGVERMPTALLRVLSRAHVMRGNEIAERAVSAGVGLLDLADVDPVTRNTARDHFLEAGALSLNLADRVVLTDDAEYADAVWQAARSFDLAGDQDVAVRVLTRFVDGFPDHPRRAEGRYRLAKAHLSRGQYERAAELFSGLVAEGSDGRPAGDGNNGAGMFAVLSYPPLARTLLLDSDPSNDQNAEQLLLEVLRGGLGGPESTVYTDALVELARLYYEADRLPEAIERLEEAVARTEDQRRVHTMRYRLADARRREAENIARTLTGPVGGSERAALEEERLEHLRRAITLYDLVREKLSAIDERQRRRLEELFLRNSYFYAADCEFDLGERQAALDRYTTARERYPNDPASLVAMMQIFNAYVAMGEYELASTAGARARRFYESLDERVWDDPLLPLTREDWERWLDASYEFAQSASVSGS